MIIFDKHIKQEVKRLKGILKIARDEQDVITALKIIYEQISNQQNKGYEKKYFLDEILQAPTLKELTKIFSHQRGNGVILEVIKYITAPNKYLIIYNEFKNSQQTRLEIFKEKENLDKCKI